MLTAREAFQQVCDEYSIDPRQIVSSLEAHTGFQLGSLPGHIRTLVEAKMAAATEVSPASAPPAPEPTAASPAEERSAPGVDAGALVPERA